MFHVKQKSMKTIINVFGWLYWKRGLEAAMISHFSADIVTHVLLAL